jgi:hypothetical protein
MKEIFTFQDLRTVEDHVIGDIVRKVSFDVLTKALSREDIKMRKRFYKNMMTLDDLHILEKKLHTFKVFDIQDIRAAQKKILALIAERPEYQNIRFEYGFESIEAFEAYITKQHEPEAPYGLVAKDVPMCRFFEPDKGNQALQDIKRKNKSDGMELIRIPTINIQLINYSVCPHCGQAYSCKDLADYYANPRADSRFKGAAHQAREDTRVFCAACETYFLPALIIYDGAVKNEFQLLSKMQTMNAIEDFYELQQNIQVLSRKQENLLRTDGFTIKIAPTDGTAGQDFAGGIFLSKPDAGSHKKVVKGIRNDVILQEMESKPTLICNLLYHTPPNLMPNLIFGTHTIEGDVLFGIWQ